MPLEYRFPRSHSSRQPALKLLQTLGPMSHAARFFTDVETICKQIPREKIELLVDWLAQLRDRSGRLFLLGVGGSPVNYSHAVNDFRKLNEPPNADGGKARG